jgi:hypothetical protein
MDGGFKEQYKLLPTVKLVAIAGSDTSEYRAEAIDSARNELKRRGESWDNAEAAKTADIAVDKGNRSLKRISKNWIAFFLGLFSFVMLDVFIPETTGYFSPPLSWRCTSSFANSCYPGDTLMLTGRIGL